LDIVAIGAATERIVVGLFKVLVVAGILSTFQKSAVTDFGEAHTLLERVAAAAWAVGSYTVYLYFNFSGYTDIVVGVARFFEIELPENFDRPFTAKKVFGPMAALAHYPVGMV
jgi:alginate O-acetyltransferase complex protein AlgI